MGKKRGRRKATLARASIAALERALLRRQRDVSRLEKRRDALQGRLARVEADLAALQGTSAIVPAAKPRGRRGKPRRGRGRGGMSLAVAISGVLEGAKKPMRAAEVTTAVLAAGYKSQAKNFRQIVHSALTRHPGAARAGKGLYVAKGKSAAVKATRPAKKKVVKRARKKKKTAKKKAAAT